MFLLWVTLSPPRQRLRSQRTTEKLRNDLGAGPHPPGSVSYVCSPYKFVVSSQEKVKILGVTTKEGRSPSQTLLQRKMVSLTLRFSSLNSFSFDLVEEDRKGNLYGTPYLSSERGTGRRKESQRKTVQTGVGSDAE